jgi:hypothetical protein
VIFAHANIFARMKLRAPLANNDAAGSDLLTTEDLNAEPFRFRIPPISRTAAAFFLCHFCSFVTRAAPGWGSAAGLIF